MYVDLPYAVQASGVLYSPFPRELAEQLLLPSEQPLLYRAKHLWYPEVQEEIYQGVCANRVARK